MSGTRPTGGDGAFRVQLFVSFLTFVAIAASRPTVTYRALDLGATPFEVGLVQSAFSILPVLTAIWLGRLVDRVGEARIVRLSIGVLALGAFLTAASESLLVLAISQAVMGAGSIWALIAGQAMIANWGSKDGRDHRFGMYSTAISLGQLVGPSLAATMLGIAALGPESERAVFLAAGIITAIAGLIALRLPQRTPAPVTAGSEADIGIVDATRTVLRRPGMVAAMYVGIAVISTIDVLVAYLPVYGEAAGISVQLVGALLSIRAAATIFSRLIMTRLIALLGWTRVLAGSLALATAGIALVPVSVSPVALIVLMILAGIGLGFGQPMTTTWVSNRATRADRGTALGVRLMGNRTAVLIVPTLIGLIAGAAGVASIFWALALFLGTGATVALSTTYQSSETSETAASSGGASVT